MNQNMPQPPACDTDTGICTPAVLPAEEAVAPPAPSPDREVIYVGDPMCSWCWGIEPDLRKLYKAATEAGMSHTVLVGGLRPGGGDRWTAEFREFLRHHWQEVGKRTGQPFCFDLLDRDGPFQYDTEPPCRAVVVAREMLQDKKQPDTVLDAFYAAVQRRFFVDNAVPAELAYYQPICAEAGLDFAEFSQRFQSEQAKAATRAEFGMVRDWGVNGFPAVLLRKGNMLYLIASGYAPAEEMVRTLHALLARPDEEGPAST